MKTMKTKKEKTPKIAEFNKGRKGAMNIISRAIREWCDINCNEYVDDYDCDELRAIADRICKLAEKEV